jgi:hypothetical protein
MTPKPKTTKKSILKENQLLSLFPHPILCHFNMAAILILQFTFQSLFLHEYCIPQKQTEKDGGEKRGICCSNLCRAKMPAARMKG